MKMKALKLTLKEKVERSEKTEEFMGFRLLPHGPSSFGHDLDCNFRRRKLTSYYLVAIGLVQNLENL